MSARALKKGVIMLRKSIQKAERQLDRPARKKHRRIVCLLWCLLLGLYTQTIEAQQKTAAEKSELVALIAGTAATASTSTAYYADLSLLADMPAAPESTTIIRAENCAGDNKPLTVYPIIDGLLTVTSTGSYYLSTDLTATVSVAVDNVCIDLGFTATIFGRLIINGANAKIVDGAIRPYAATGATTAAGNAEALLAGVEITSSATGTQLLNVMVTCLALSDVTNTDNPASDCINGRLAVKNTANSVTMSECSITAAYGQGFNRTSPNAITFNRNTGSGGIGILNSGNAVLVQNCQISAGNGGNINASTANNVSVTINGATGVGGTGISNTGTDMQITHCSITAGSSGSMTASNSFTGVSASVASIQGHSGAGGSGIFNTAVGMHVQGGTIHAGNSGAGTTTALSDPFIGGLYNSYITGSTGPGGSGVSNQGTNMHVEQATIYAGMSGDLQANVRASGIDNSAATGAGGIGISNSGDAIQITQCAITAGSSGKMYVAVFTGYDAQLGSSTVTINQGGPGISNSGSNTLISQSYITAATGGKADVVASSINKKGSANGGAGGHGIVCVSPASNVTITGCIIQTTGNGGTGYRSGTPGPAVGKGGDAGNGIQIDSSCSNIQLRDIRVNALGIGGTSVTGGGTGANGLLMNTPTNYRSLIFSAVNLPSLTAPLTINYFKKVS